LPFACTAKVHVLMAIAITAVDNFLTCMIFHTPEKVMIVLVFGKTEKTIVRV